MRKTLTTLAAMAPPATLAAAAVMKTHLIARDAVSDLGTETVPGRLAFVFTVADFRTKPAPPSCPRCFDDQSWMRSRVRLRERLRSLFSIKRPFRCTRCGVRRWFTP